MVHHEKLDPGGIAKTVSKVVRVVEGEQHVQYCTLVRPTQDTSAISGTCHAEYAIHISAIPEM